MGATNKIKIESWILQYMENTEIHYVASGEDLYDFHRSNHWVIQRFVSNTVFPNRTLKRRCLIRWKPWKVFVYRLYINLAHETVMSVKLCSMTVTFAFQPENEGSISSRFNQQINLIPNIHEQS